MGRSLRHRFWQKVEIDETTGCWRWIAHKNVGGYGKMQNRFHQSEGAHRLAWEIMFGAIQRDLCVLHCCDTRDCCNPYHCFLGTRVDNAVDRQAKGRTHNQKSPVARAKGLRQFRCVL